jgi:hypothetical protein
MTADPTTKKVAGTQIRLAFTGFQGSMATISVTFSGEVDEEVPTETRS